MADVLIYPDPVSHPKLSAELQGVLLEEDTPGPVVSVDIKILDPNVIATSAAANSGITNTTGVYDYIYAPTLIFTIKPAPDVETDDEHEDS